MAAVKVRQLVDQSRVSSFPRLVGIQQYLVFDRHFDGFALRLQLGYDVEITGCIRNTYDSGALRTSLSRSDEDSVPLCILDCLIEVIANLGASRLEGRRDLAW